MNIQERLEKLENNFKEASLGNVVATYRDIKIYNPQKGVWLLKYNGNDYDKRHLDGWDVEIDGKVNNANLQKVKQHVDKMLKKESLSQERLEKLEKSLNKLSEKNKVFLVIDSSKAAKYLKSLDYIVKDIGNGKINIVGNDSDFRDAEEELKNKKLLKE